MKPQTLTSTPDPRVGLYALALGLRSHATVDDTVAGLRRVGAREASQMADALCNACTSEVAGLMAGAWDLLLDSQRVQELQRRDFIRRLVEHTAAERLAWERELCLSALAFAGLDANGTDHVARELRGLQVALAAPRATWLELTSRRAALARSVAGYHAPTGKGCGPATPTTYHGPTWESITFRQPRVEPTVQLSLPLAGLYLKDQPKKYAGIDLTGIKRVVAAPTHTKPLGQLVLPGLAPAPAPAPATVELYDRGGFDGWYERYPEMYPANPLCFAIGRPGTKLRPVLGKGKVPRQAARPAKSCRSRWTSLEDELNQLAATGPGLLGVLAIEERKELYRWVGRGRQDAAFQRALESARHFVARETARLVRWGKLDGKKIAAMSAPAIAGFRPTTKGGVWCSSRKCECHAQYKDERSNRPYCQHHAESLAARRGQ